MDSSWFMFLVGVEMKKRNLRGAKKEEQGNKREYGEGREASDPLLYYYYVYIHLHKPFFNHQTSCHSPLNWNIFDASYMTTFIYID